MANITAVLLALMLTGAPVEAICLAECQHEPVTSGHCHRLTATNDHSTITANDSCRDPSLGEGPYVVTSRETPGAAALTTEPFTITTELAGTGASVVPGLVRDVWLKPPLVLRL